MELLLDTNIFLEVILEQEKAGVARNLLSNIEKYEFYISDYSLHSIGLLLLHRKQYNIFLQFLTDMISNVGVKMISLTVKDMEDLTKSAQRFNLDFDDAYQYTIAEKYNLKIISFDSDFDRTKRGRITPDKI